MRRSRLPRPEPPRPRVIGQFGPTGAGPPGSTGRIPDTGIPSIDPFIIGSGSPAVVGGGGSGPVGTTLAASSASVGESFFTIFRTTMPDEILRHNISDEDLTMFGDASRDGLSEAMWAMFGAAIGFAPSAFSGIWSAYLETPRTPLNGLQQIEIICFIAALAIAITISSVAKRRGNKTEAKIKQIRDRTSAHKSHIT